MADKESTTVTKSTAISIALVVVLIAASITGAAQFAHLSAEVGHLAEELAEVKKELQQMRGHQTSVTAANARTLALVLERMQQDDVRERKDTSMLDELDKRMRALEVKK